MFFSFIITSPSHNVSYQTFTTQNWREDIYEINGLRSIKMLKYNYKTDLVGRIKGV